MSLVAAVVLSAVWGCLLCCLSLFPSRRLPRGAVVGRSPFRRGRRLPRGCGVCGLFVCPGVAFLSLGRVLGFVAGLCCLASGPCAGSVASGWSCVFVARALVVVVGLLGSVVFRLVGGFAVEVACLLPFWRGAFFLCGVK